MSSTRSDDDDGSIGGSLLVSNMNKWPQSPRRREILDMIGLAGRYTAEPSPLNEEELQIELAQKTIYTT